MRFLLLLPLLASCSRGSSDDCNAVARHYASMVEESVEKAGDPDRVKQARATLPALVDVMRQTCEKAEWSGAIRRCILDARTIGALEACDPTQVQKAETAPE